MPWKTINQILGLAAADPAFWQALQENPLEAIQSQGFELTAEEREVFGETSVNNLREFSQYLIRRLGEKRSERDSS